MTPGTAANVADSVPLTDAGKQGADNQSRKMNIYPMIQTIRTRTKAGSVCACVMLSDGEQSSG